MLGEIFGRNAGLGCDELLRFLPLAGTLKSARAAALPFGDVAEATAGLGGIEGAPVPAVPFVVGVRADMVGVACESTCVFKGCKRGVPASVAAGAGSVDPFIGNSDAPLAAAAPEPEPEPDLAMFMSDAGVAGALAARDCWSWLCGVRYGDRPAEADRGAEGGSMPWPRASKSGSGESESADSDV